MKLNVLSSYLVSLKFSSFSWYLLSLLFTSHFLLLPTPHTIQAVDP